MPGYSGRSPRVRRATPCRAHSSTSTRRSTNRSGSWMPRGTRGSRSATVTATNRASAVSLIVSSTSTPPGRRIRHASATVPRRSVTCSRSSPALTTSAQPSASGSRVTSARTGVTPWAAAWRSAESTRSTPTCRYPLSATCGASRPAPRPRSTSTAPDRVAGGISLARASAIQCSIANTPSGRHHSPARSSYCRTSFLGRVGVRMMLSVT